MTVPAGRHPLAHPAYTTPDDRDLVDDRATPGPVFAALSSEFGPFTVDVAAAAHNTKTSRYYARADNGLDQDWSGETVWCNPPYSSIEPWVRKAWASPEAHRVVMLLPADRTEQPWWQTFVEPYRDQPASPLRTRFLARRIRFLKPGQTAVRPHERPLFGCVVLIWTPGLGYAGPDVATLFD